MGPACLSLQLPPHSPGEHLATSLQDILGRASHLFFVAGALQGPEEDQTKRLSSKWFRYTAESLEIGQFQPEHPAGAKDW